MYHLYLVKCQDGTLYTGITTNLKRRIKEHNTSELGAKYTRGRRPVKLVYAKKYLKRSTATRAEGKLKQLSHLAKVEIINHG